VAKLSTLGIIAMKIYPITFLLLALIIGGCKPAAEREKQERMKQFQKQMMERDASVTLGMARPDVIAVLGEPFWTTNNYSKKYQIVDLYQFQPPVLHWQGVITGGFEIFFSNNVVIEKHPIKATAK
jgi:hypothetical protein